jgi:hypothetical protein
MAFDSPDDDAPELTERPLQVGRRMVSDDGVNWRPHDWQNESGRSARFERIEISAQSED